MKILCIFLGVILCSPAFSAEMSKAIGTVVHIKTGNSVLDQSHNQKLHFCLFENGESDLLYVGTNYGMWKDGWIELQFYGKIVYSGNVPDLLYSGTFLDLGDVIEKQPESNSRLYVTKVKGIFK